MIAVAGEALVDLIVDPSGSVVAVPGGAPFNVARMVARLGGECRFIGRLSDDAFGRRLGAVFEEENVHLGTPDATRAPTTLALAELDDAGTAEYRFYLEGTSAPQLEPGDLPLDLLSGCRALAFGALAIVVEPIASALLELLATVPPSVTVLLDPNCRPSAISDLPEYRRRLEMFLRRVDIVKVSVGDLAVIDGDHDSRDAARRLLDAGPVAVLVTDGPAPVLVHTAAAEHIVPVPRVDVVDTVGAGDAFVAGFLTWWSNHSRLREDAAHIDLLVEAAGAAVQAAAAACATRGANLPDDFVWG